MNCSHFGKCGSCSLYNISYEEALKAKVDRVKELISSYYSKKIDIFSSIKSNHRARAEFKIWHKGDMAYYAMSNLDKNGVEILSECPKVTKPIENIWKILLKEINNSDILKNRLFSIEFLSSQDEVLVTMIYHKKLDSLWEEEAKSLQDRVKISIIGRARKQKIVLNREYVTQKIKVDNREFSYRYYEGGFTQPNSYINQKMITWAIDKVKDNGGDFLESYCGLGNFTLPISRYFSKVLATEISSNSIKAAKENCKLNRIENISFVRLNAQETAFALKGVREFRRLKGINLNEFNFTTILVDPPRAGLDYDSLNLAKDFKYIVYISCNPQTLARDLKELTKTHIVKNVAVFDQFPYTSHIESGVYLVRRDIAK